MTGDPMNEELESHPLIEDPAPFGAVSASDELRAMIDQLRKELLALEERVQALQRHQAGKEVLAGVVFGPARQR